MYIIMAVGKNLLECLEVHNPRYIVADFISLTIAYQLAFSNPVACMIPLRLVITQIFCLKWKSSGPVIFFPPNLHLHSSIVIYCCGIYFVSDANIKYILAPPPHIKSHCSSLLRFFHGTSLSLCPLVVVHMISALNLSSSILFTCCMQCLMHELCWYIGRLS